MKRCWLLIAVLFASLAAGALDRAAFTFLSYRLDAQIDRTSHVIAVTGRLVLRNDAKSPQKVASLQVSSQLEWNAIGTDDKPADCNCIVEAQNSPLQWLGQSYTSDIDHTGALSEAIVTFPKEVPPGGTVVLDVQYGGRITTNATRLTRIGVPQELALRNDWDQISDTFTAVRGLGYVVWYPVSIEAVSLSDGNAVSDAVARWKERHRNSQFFSYLGAPVENEAGNACILSNVALGSGYWRVGGGARAPEDTGAKRPEAFPYNRGITLQSRGLQSAAPAFVIMTSCDTFSRPAMEVTFAPEHSLIAKDYAIAAESNDGLLKDWLPETATPIRVIELSEAEATPYQDGGTLLVPLLSSTQQNLQLLLLPAQVSARFSGARAWMQQGLGLLLQARSVQSHEGRAGALRFLSRYQQPLVKAEDVQPAADSSSKAPRRIESDNTLLNTSDEIYLRVKSGFVFWMLCDMLGDAPVQRALGNYKASGNDDPTQFQKLLQAETKQNLEWFFDDWVYRDRGLPEFHIESAVTRKLLDNSSSSAVVVTATIENRGDAGAEVPVLVQTAAGEKGTRLVIKAHDKATARIEVPEAPARVVVNDGSVPESDQSKDVYAFETKPES